MSKLANGYYSLTTTGDGRYIKSFNNTSKPQFSFVNVPVVCKCGCDAFEVKMGMLPNREEQEGVTCTNCGMLLLQEDIVPFDHLPQEWNLSKYIELFHPNAKPKDKQRIREEWQNYLKSLGCESFTIFDTA